MSASKNPILKLVQLTEELWNERKAVDFARDEKHKEQEIKRCEKLISQIEELMPALKAEPDFLRKLSGLKD